MESLVLQLKLMALVMVYVEIYARGNIPVYCNKAIGINMQSHAVAGFVVVNIAKQWQQMLDGNAAPR